MGDGVKNYIIFWKKTPKYKKISFLYIWLFPFFMFLAKNKFLKLKPYSRWIAADIFIFWYSIPFCPWVYDTIGSGLFKESFLDNAVVNKLWI